MAEEKSQDKAEVKDIKNTPEYRKFRALLKRVVKAPPLKRKSSPSL